MKKKIKKRYTLKEFQAWLSGIEEIQPDDWHPDLDQWKLIRDRLDNIIVEVQEKVIEREVEVEVLVPIPGPMGPTDPRPSHMAPPGSVTAPYPTPAPVNNTPPPLIPPVAVPEDSMTPAARAALRGELPANGPATAAPGGPVHRLPNDPAAADPSAPGQPYASSFV